MPFTLSQHFSAQSPYASFPCADLVWSCACAYVVCAYSILFVKQSVSWTDKITLAAATARTPPPHLAWIALGSRARVWNVHKIVAPINAAMNYARDAWSSTTTSSSLCVVCVSCRAVLSIIIILVLGALVVWGRMWCAVFNARASVI